MLTTEGCSETGRFRHLSNHIFRKEQIRKYLSYDTHLSLKMFKILCSFQKRNVNLAQGLRFLR